MTKQPEAERLADCLETHHRLASPNEEAAAELRRLSSFNQQLMDEVERLNKALDEWHDKTAWVQTSAQPMELGMHRADVLKQRIEALAQQPAQRPVKTYCGGKAWPVAPKIGCVNHDCDQCKAQQEPLTDALWGLLDAVENELNRRAIPEAWLLMAHKAGRAYIEAAHGITKGQP